VVAVLLALIAVTVLLLRWQSASRVWRAVALTMVVVAFVLLKSPGLVQLAKDLVSRWSLQTSTINPTPLSWLGYSYVAFRLMHTIRDRQSGRLPALSLSEYMNYAIFFPAFTAGPIDRAERFVRELRTPLPLNDEDWIDAGSRFFVGLFKKFVVADLLGVISISDQLAPLVRSPGWLWFFLYAYALRIYFDFSGYTDVAIGLGRLLGIRLPENFAAPYLKSNLTQFWNSWHMTLTQWFRSYVFNPLTRRMRSAGRQAPVWLVILVGQLSTMLLIGLWHGITWSFAAWGLWHGLGLFIHNRWADFARNRMPAWTNERWGKLVMYGSGVFLTFNFVALGWLFFVLSDPSLSLHTLARLFGIS
jgi:D-alanyl-lipoteichoic acid acyltransferase DltB (MBOAT superfamily)